MALTAGTRLGPYEITALIGAGGMGEVYRATDTRLDRTVAIKVLPEHLADDPQRRERFEREARAVSSLNHPHICTLHDVGEQDGIHYLVMEYVEGETLQQRLEKGRLPLDQALEYAIQIADALDKAHRQGVVHRDLKPGNIMLTKSGTKLLDFGLAKLKGDAVGVSPLSQMPTQDASVPLTAEGTILGTLQYMAPEQLEGKEADARTDIFAFGAVVYEMVTGKKAFEGASPASLIAAIMEHDPAPVSRVQLMTPPALDHVVRTCLAKDADDRWQTAHDLMVQFSWIAEGGTQLGLPAPVTIRRRKKERLAWSLVVLLALSTLGFGVVSLRLASVDAPSTTRLAVTLPEESSLEIGGWPRLSLAISPGGQRIVYRGRDPDDLEGQLYSRFLDQLAVEALPGTEGASQPFFSPDGNWVAFFTESGELKKLRLDGGSPVTIAAGIPNSRWAFGSWYDDTIVFAGFTSPIQQVPAEGGAAPTSLSTLDQGERAHRFPIFIPETGDVLFTVSYSDGRRSRVELIRRDTLERFLIIDTARALMVTESGHLWFFRDGALIAVPFDPAARQITGPVQPLPESVALDSAVTFQLVASESGTIAYVPARPDLPDPTLGWVDRSRAFTELGPVPPASRLSGLSPDGHTALIEVRGVGNNEIFSFDLLRGIPTPIYVRARFTGRARWHPDGQRITLGGRALSLLDIDSGAESDLIEEGDQEIRLGSWSPDGGTLAYMSFTPQENIYALTPGEGEPQPVVATDAREHSPVISPDGEWIAYVSDESGLNEVWVAQFPEGIGRRRISNGGGTEPLWSRDGRELFFGGLIEDGTFSLKVVTISVADGLEIGPAQVLFPVPNRPENETFRIGGNSGPTYDISPDGSRFLMIKESTGPPQTEIIVIQNWFEELKRLVPADN